MFTRFVVAAALLLAPFAVACGSDDAKTDSSDIISSNGEGTLGAMCGGFAGISCAQGFECVTQGGWADAIGTCQPALNLGGEGATCGGIAGLKCNEGLTCSKTSTAADASGTCTKPAITCAAVPACDSHDTKVDTCPTGGSCYTRSLCGKSITCAK